MNGKGRQVRHREAGARIPNVLPTIMQSAGIGFSSAHNARHGLREWLAVLVGTCSQSLTAESAARNLKNTRAVPSEKWFRDMMNTISRARAEAVCEMMVRRTARLAKRRGMGGRGSVLAAVDRHLIGRFDRDNMEHLVYSAWRGGHQQVRGVRHGAGRGGARERGARVRRGCARPAWRRFRAQVCTDLVRLQDARAPSCPAAGLVPSA